MPARLDNLRHLAHDDLLVRLQHAHYDDLCPRGNDGAAALHRVHVRHSRVRLRVEYGRRGGPGDDERRRGGHFRRRGWQGGSGSSEARAGRGGRGGAGACGVVM
jgi:hypothetical protein